MALEQRSKLRAIALRVLTHVLSEHENLDRALSREKFPDDDRAWLLDVCSGTLRWKARLDWIIDSISLKKKPTGGLRKALLVAAYQIIVQDKVPASLVVSEVVSEIKEKEGPHPAGFANALLRKVADHASEWRNWKWNTGVGSAEASAWASLPEWFWKKLVSQHGSQWSQEFALASLARPKIWARIEGESEPVVLDGGAVFKKTGFDEGKFFVQDISSQRLVSEISKNLKPGMTVLDLCAAPGGKSVGLAWNGMKVTAADLSDERLKLLRATVERVGRGSVKVMTKPEVAELELQDLVWVDAPCTGSGIVRRHPDIRWNLKEKELGDLIRVQRDLLEEGWQKVKPGGFLAYSVCSVFKEEGPEVVEEFLKKSAGKLEQQWSFAPQDPEGGDGFWGALVWKG